MGLNVYTIVYCNFLAHAENKGRNQFSFVIKILSNWRAISPTTRQSGLTDIWRVTLAWWRPCNALRRLDFLCACVALLMTPKQVYGYKGPFYFLLTMLWYHQFQTVPNNWFLYHEFNLFFFIILQIRICGIVKLIYILSR